MNRQFIPQSVLDAAHARSAARMAGQWEIADQLRGQIESAGWRVVDSGTNFRLETSEPPDRTDGDVIRYGRSGAVPSRLGEPPSARATIVVVATDAPGAIHDTLAGLLANLGQDDHVLVIVDGPAPAIEISLGGLAAEVEVVRTAERLGAGAALNIGMRRSRGEIVVLLDASVVATGDIVAPLASMLADPGIAVVGASGRTSANLRTYADVVAGGDVTSIASGVLAFRRADGVAVGPVDEAFSFGRHLDTWWSLTLRRGIDEHTHVLIRRAVVVDGVPVVMPPPTSVPGTSDPEIARQSKRNFYRVLDRFRGYPELLGADLPAWEERIPRQP